MQDEKRVVRTYKVKESVYSVAQKTMDDMKFPLANFIEAFVEAIPAGRVKMVKRKNGFMTITFKMPTPERKIPENEIWL